MSNLISRQAAIEAVNELTYPSSLMDVKIVLANLPSAEPKRKTGHWVYEDGKMGFGIGAWCCSECGEENESLPFHKCKNPYAYAASKYCACCGAKMETNRE